MAHWRADAICALTSRRAFVLPTKGRGHEQPERQAARADAMTNRNMLRSVHTVPLLARSGPGKRANAAASVNSENEPLKANFSSFQQIGATPDSFYVEIINIFDQVLQCAVRCVISTVVFRCGRI